MRKLLVAAVFSVFSFSASAAGPPSPEAARAWEDIRIEPAMNGIAIRAMACGIRPDYWANTVVGVLSASVRIKLVKYRLTGEDREYLGGRAEEELRKASKGTTCDSLRGTRLLGLLDQMYNSTYRGS